MANANFFMVGNEFIDVWAKKLGESAIVVYAALRRISNKVAVVSKKTYRYLSNLLGMRVEKIGKAIKDLSKHGLIEIRRGVNRGYEYVAILHPTPIKPEVAAPSEDLGLFDLMEVSSVPPVGTISVPPVGTPVNSLHVCIKKDTTTEGCCAEKSKESIKIESDLKQAGVWQAKAEELSQSENPSLVKAILRFCKGKRMGGGAIVDATKNPGKYGLEPAGDGAWLTPDESADRRRRQWAVDEAARHARATQEMLAARRAEIEEGRLEREAAGRVSMAESWKKHLEELVATL